MMDGVKSYPQMADSGVDWLGLIPAHWHLPRLGAVMRERGELNGNGDIDEVLSVVRNRGVIPYSEKGNIGNKKSDDVTRYKVVRPQDIVVNCMNVIIGSVGISRYTGCLSPVYYVLTARSEEVDPQYLNACFQTRSFQRSLIRLGNGILAHRMRIPMELLKCEPFPRPPLSEQTAIARFLDHMDRRIQRYIRAKERLIALLEEYKQALIHQAVTGQIDVRTVKPYEEYKESGVGWLGKVPRHWNVCPLKRAFSTMEYGVSDSGTDLGHIALLTMANVSDGVATTPPRGGVASVDPNLLLQDEDLLFNRTNSRELVGKVGLYRTAERPATFASYLVRMRASEENVPQFLNLLLNDTAFLASARRKAIPSLHQSNLNPTRYGRLPITLPPRLEQRAIVDWIEHGRSRLDGVSAAARREIHLLNEYRTRLIADIVTGKVDVREAAASLPDSEVLEAASRFDDP